MASSKHRVERWLHEREIDASRLERLTGDVSPRCYWRAHTAHGSLIVVDYPESLEHAFDAFRETTRLLTEAGIPVPAIFEADPEELLMLVEDAGRQTLYEQPAGDVDLLPLYERVIGYARRIAELPTGAARRLHPPLDGELLRREIDQTTRLVLRPRIAERGACEALEEALEAICSRLHAMPPVAAHRDLMSRNVMVRDGHLTVIDHQDFRLAPPNYDLASLLYDSCRLTSGRRDSLVGRIIPRSQRQDFDRVVVQRLVKIAGTFQAFAERGDPRHVAMIDPALQVALVRLRKLDEGRHLPAELIPGVI